ncbi:MAG: GNAT family N-acetyltransferase [Opitutaceae bacterium]|nr:GNAT family N-acetyltransferase [Opitutaceae bacterium]
MSAAPAVPPASAAPAGDGRIPALIETETLNPLLDPRWESWLEEQPDATVFHTTAWARVLADTYNFAPCYFTGAGRSGHRVLVPMFEIDSWITGRRGISLPFSDFCRPLGDEGTGVPQPIYARIQRHATERRWDYIECRGTLPNHPDAAVSLRYYTHDLGLNRSEDAIFAAFHPSVRRAIRKAEKSGLTVEITDSISAIREYFRLHGLTRRRHGLPPQPISFFRAIHRHIVSQGMGFTVVVRKGGQAIASVIFFHRGSNGLFKFGASDERFQGLRPTNLALWSGMCECRKRGIQRLSLGRNATNHETLRRFKLSWGAEETSLAYSKFDCASGRFVSDRSLLDGWQNHVFRRMPLPIARCLGALLYRHIA